MSDRKGFQESRVRHVRPTPRLGVVFLGGILIVAVGACAPGDSGGNDPLEPAGEPGRPLPALTEGEQGRFLLGRALFERLATPEEGLGPLFNAARCSACHAEPAVGGTGFLLVTKASRWEGGVCSELRDQGGGNIQQRTTPALMALGVQSEPMPSGATEEARFLAPPLFGLGLLEAVPEDDLLALEDPEDRDGDGVSGRVHRLPDGRVGRFGWKGDSPSIAHFVDTAIRFEIGLTTPDFPVEEGVNGAPLPEGVDPMPEPEIDRNGVSLLVDYIRFLAAPARLPDSALAEPTGDVLAQVRLGEALFTEVGCARCHVPELRTAASGTPALDGRRIRPYTDLLLHDLGPELRGTCGGSAGPTEYRTPPLWGLRHRDQYLHDGRAGSLDEALSLHGGEASRARQAFVDLSPAERSALLDFLASL